MTPAPAGADAAVTAEPHRLRSLRHELRNALSAAAIHLDLLAQEGRPVGELERIAAVRDALDQALGLSERLLEGGGDAEGTADVASVVRQCVRLARPLVEQRGRLSQWLPGDVGSIALNEVEARELVLNLLLNAGQALRVGGRVRVSARAVGSLARILVEDDGAGMSEQTLERAFQPGFSTRPDGSGYGLVRVKDLVEKAGGRIRIQSRPEIGTRVEIDLPLVSRAR